jgi:hypothetical protein
MPVGAWPNAPPPVDPALPLEPGRAPSLRSPRSFALHAQSTADNSSTQLHVGLRIVSTSFGRFG